MTCPCSPASWQPRGSSRRARGAGPHAGPARPRRILPGYGRQAPNPFGLGVEVRGNKSPHWTGKGNSPRTFGHFGQSGSFIWVDPVAGRQAVFLGAEPFGPVHRRTWPALGDQILAL